MNEFDAAESARLAEAISTIMPTLERFNQFEGNDLAARERSVWTDALDEPLPKRGTGLDEVLHQLAETVIRYGLRIGAPGFSGWVTNAPTTAAVAAALAASVAGPQRYFIHAFNHLEAVALRWLGGLCGLPSELQGVFTSGGSTANLVGIGAARQRAFERLGRDPARDGLPSDVSCRIYASKEVHHVVGRSAGVLGLGRRAVATISVDADLRVDINHLSHLLKGDKDQGILPVAIVATAGTVNTGAIDPIEEMAEIASEYDTWLHVDGAYGLFGVLDPRVAPLFRGLEKADSVVVDPHKWLAAPVGIGAVFVRDRELLTRAFTQETAEYLEGLDRPGEVLSPFDNVGETYHEFGVEHSAPSRGVQVWAILKEIGVEGMRERVIRHNDFARHLAARVEADHRLELLSRPVLSICCFRYAPPYTNEEELNRLNEKITRRLRAETPYGPSTTRVNGKLAIRPCYVNPRSTLADVDGLLEEVRRIGDSLVA